MKETTIEITDYCPNECPYCSSYAGPQGKNFLEVDDIDDFLGDEIYDRINISGGEPLAHPKFYEILKICKNCVTPRTGFVAVYTNELDCIMFNANIKSGVRVEANVPLLPNTDKVHILKMVEQGYEAERPDVHYSCNWNKDECGGCSNRVLKPDGTIGNNPCTKNVVNKKEKIATKSLKDSDDLAKCGNKYKDCYQVQQFGCCPTFCDDNI